MAQIDHLIINRLMEIWVCESKHFAEGVAINEQGEWSRYYTGRAHGMPSRSSRTADTSSRSSACSIPGAVPLPKRLGTIAIKPDLKPVVLVSNNARISRPRGAKVDAN